MGFTDFVYSLFKLGYVVSVTASAWEVSLRFPRYFVSLDLFLGMCGDFLNFPYMWLLLSLCVCVRAHAQSLQLCLTFFDPKDCSRPGSSVHGILQARVLEQLPFPPLGYLPDPGTEPSSPVSPALQADSLPTEPPGKLLTILVLKCMVPKRWKREKWREKKTDARDFPGGPLVKNLCFHCRGHSFHIWSGN